MIKAKKKKQRKTVILLVAVALLVVLLALGGSFLHGRVIRLVGVELKPSRDYPLHEVTHYLQNDPAWGAEAIGQSRYTMGGAGCLVTSAAISMNDMGVAISPQELNERLTAVEGYDNADLLWYKLKEAVPGVDYTYSRAFSSATIDGDLAAGRLPVVKVRYRGAGIDHWVLIVGAKGGEYYISDPMNGDAQAIPLSTHGDRAYAYRVLVSTAADESAVPAAAVHKDSGEAQLGFSG